jgi:hypothetical protein
MGLHFVTVLLTGLVLHNGTPLCDGSFAHRLYQPRIGRDNVTDAWDNGDYDEGRSMRFPSGLDGPCYVESVHWKKSLDHTHE